MLIDTHRLSGTTSSGTFSVTTKDINGLMRLVVAEPATALTQYDISITNALSIKIYERTAEVGTLAEEVALPLARSYTITIENATNDEAFTLQLMVQV